MHLIPESAKEKLSIPEVLKLIASEARGIPSAALISALKPSTDKLIIAKKLERCSEMMDILEKEELPDYSIPELAPFLSKVRIAESFLREEELFKLLHLIQGSVLVKNFARRHREDYPAVWEIFENYEELDEVSKAIRSVIDKNGQLKTNASRELQRIFSELIRYESIARKRLLKLFREAGEKGWTGDTEISLRNGRFVIPILAEYKRKLKGFIHDESATGQTVFIEPAEILELNNEVRNLHMAKEREIRKILVKTTDAIRPHLDKVIHTEEILCAFDVISSSVVWARKNNAVVPIISENGIQNIINGRHCLLEIHQKAIGQEMIPLNIFMSPEERIVVLSGPNAGGKSVALKTIGQLQILFQCGLPVMCDAKSTFKVFEKLMVDIGDDQSIDNDLSTYSSHLSNMKAFLDHADSQTLFLIDEFGTGTDPRYGGAIAAAILQSLNDKRCYGLANTHYSDLKAMAAELPGIVNAAMEYDLEGFKPKYTLRLGVPGSSFALEIAENTGISKSVLNKASELIGNEQLEVEQLTHELEAEQAELHRLKSLISEKDALLTGLIRKYEEKHEKLKLSSEKTLKIARAEANAILERTKLSAERTLAALKKLRKEEERNKGEAAASSPSVSIQKILDSEGIKDLEKKLVADQEKQTEKEEARSVRKDLGPAQIGDAVRIKGSSQQGILIELKGKSAVVEAKGLRIRTSFNQLQKAEPTKENSSTPKNVSGGNYGTMMSEASVNFKEHMDLRGSSRQEALDIVVKQVEWALVLGRKRLSFLHGKGDGVLKKAIREELDKFKEVKSYNSAHADMGGDGITEVELH